MRQQTRDLRSGLPAAILAVAVAVSLIVVPARVRADSFLTTWFRPGCQAPPVYPPAEAPFPPAARFPAARFPAARYPAAEVPADSVVPYAAEPPVACGTPGCGCGESGVCCGGELFALHDGLGGVIDNAVLRDRVRIRYDHLKGVNFPDRAEYLFGALQDVGGPAGTAPGNLKYQELTTYVEWKFHHQLSLFGEFPIRFVDNAISRLEDNFAVAGTHQAGAGDVTAGLRYALLQKPGRHVTAQLKIYTPTGDVSRFLGRGHSSIEAGLLFQHQWDRLTLFGEILDWQASAGTVVPDGFEFSGDRFSGNVLRYGLGAGYDLGRRIDHHRTSRLTFLCEVVGWTVVDGLKTTAVFVDVSDLPPQRVLVPADASGDTIVNGTFGLRYTVGCNTFYLGYGTDWSGPRWYSDQFRMEFGHNF